MTFRIRPRLLVAVGTIAILASAVWLWQRRQNASFEEVMAETPIRPSKGLWSYAPLDGEAEEEEALSDETARLLSLPYVAGTKVTAGGTSGVVAHAPDHAYQGVNLYVSGHGPEALLVSMEGRLLHRWRLPYSDAFPDRQGDGSTEYWRRAHLLPDGEILAIFQGAGMIKVDADSRLLWSLDLGLYNDLEVAPDGTIYALTKKAREGPELGRSGLVLEDSVVALSPAGRPREQWSILEAFVDTPYEALLEPLGPTEDILHTNTVEYLDGSKAAVSGIFRRGNLLLSMRENDLLAILDPTTRKIVWAARGDWRRQHQPTLLADGNLLLFDNQGAGAGYSRVIELDPMSGEIRWDYRGPPTRRLASSEAGSCQRLPNGNTLITESEQGRAFEIDHEGHIVWEFASPHRAGMDDAFVATLFEVVRLESEFGSFRSDLQ